MRKIFVSFVLNHSVTSLSEGRFKNAVVEMKDKIEDEYDIKELQMPLLKSITSP